MSNQQVGMLLIDYETAYGRTEWRFIRIVLESLGFLQVFCHMVSTLMNGARALVEINKARSKEFELTRSI